MRRHIEIPIAAVVIAALLARILTLGVPGLLDPSEGRFASIALRMLQSGDWITPQIHQHIKGWVPYFAKPPLLMWLAALSFEFIGINEIAARLPSLLASLSIVVVLRVFSKRFFPEINPWLAPLLYLTSCGAFLLGFSAVTDTVLTALIAISMLSAAIVLDTRSKRREPYWGLLFFAALALGVLTKGPLIVVLSAGAIGTWLTITKNLSALRRFPWIGGISLFILIASPWYYAAEQASPGFFRYFIFEENFARYLSGNYRFRYGSDHPRPFGTIWGIAAICVVPWVFLVRSVAWRQWRSFAEFIREHQWCGFALLWWLVPLLFFTFTRQILPTYTLPALPALALSGAWLIHERKISSSTISRIGVAAVLLYTALFLTLATIANENYSTKALFSYLRAHSGSQPQRALFLIRDPFSAHFYSQTGPHPIEVKVLLDPSKHATYDADFVIFRASDTGRIPSEVQDHLERSGTVGKWVVMKARGSERP